MCFQDEEKITVGSSAYNLAGEVERRGNFMKNNILSLVFSGVSNTGLGKGIVAAHMAGPAMSFNRFYEWAEFSGYNTQVGNLGGLVYSSGAMSAAGFQFLVPVKTEPIIPTPVAPPLTRVTHDQRAITSSIGPLNLHLIALEWIIKNTPDNRDLPFVASLEKTFGYFPTFTGKILITYTSLPAVTFTPAYDLNGSMPFLYLYHEERPTTLPVITDTGWITLTPPDTPPAKVGFTGTPTTEVISGDVDKTTTTVITYSNGSPSSSVVTVEPVPLTFDHIVGVYTKTTTVVATTTIVGKVTELVQHEESFFEILYTPEVTSSSTVIQQTYENNLYNSSGILTNTYLDSAGLIVTPSPSNALSISWKIPIAAGQKLTASHGPGTGYIALYNSSDVYIAGSATNQNYILFSAGAAYARFTYPTVNAGSYTVYLTEDVTVTTTVTVVTPSVDVFFKYKQVTTETSQEKWLPYLLKIYQKGSSSEGDSLLFSTPTVTQKFFPVIPLRRDNVMVDLANFPTQYDWNRKATKKCFGTKKKYNDLLDSLADNPSLADIDHAWVVFGVSLSTKQKEGQKYLYEFFKDLSDNTISTPSAIKSPSDYEAAWAAFALATTTSTNDETGTAVTGRPMPPVAQEYTLTVNASAGTQDWRYNTTITAKGGGQVVGTGYHPKALGKVGNIWVYAKSTVTVSVPTFYDGEGITYSPAQTTVIAFGKQITTSNWVEYEFFDLVHVNTVYRGLTVTTLGTTVIASLSENSSFIIPLHENTFKDLTLVRRTQLSLECSFLVINYYDKQTIPWYATSSFQIVLIAAIIVITVYTGGIGAGSSGVLGTNAVVGASLGFVGTAAIIAGAIANAVAAAIVSALITKVAVSALGEDVGRIVGLIASMITINLMSSNGPVSLADSWTQMTKADNLIRFSLSGISEYGNYTQNQAIKVNAETQAMMAEANESLKEINRLMQELLGNTGVDPSTITNAIRYATENPEQFFNRTTMTGTEIAETSIKLVEDFPVPQLALPYVT